MLLEKTSYIKTEQVPLFMFSVVICIFGNHIGKVVDASKNLNVRTMTSLIKLVGIPNGQF